MLRSGRARDPGHGQVSHWGEVVTIVWAREATQQEEETAGRVWGCQAPA